jgi:hypothetical protein
MPSTLHYTDALATHNPQTAGNYLENAAPASGDTVIIRSRLLVDGNTGGDGSITASLAQSAVILARLVIEQSFTGLIGTAAAPWQIGAVVVEIGQDSGFGAPVGSQRVNLNLADAGGVTTVTVYNTCDSSAESYLPPVRLLTHNAAAVIEVRKGSVGIGVLGEACTLSAIRESFAGNVEGDADVVVGNNVTVATIDKVGGDLALRSAATTVTNAGGNLITEGSGAIGTLTVGGGMVISNSTGTITALALNAGLTDFTQSRDPRTVTTVTGRAGASMKYDPAVVTLTNKITSAEAVLVQFSAAA